MPLQILGHARDLKSQTPVIYCQASIPEYLAIVGDEFSNFNIQRRREVHKAYQRLSHDIREGALVPSITLAVKPDIVAQLLPFLTGPADALVQELSIPGRVDILDGLQRTYIMSDLVKDGHQYPVDQRVLIEFWLEADIQKLIYRIIVLNAGQKPMSIRHQVELLFMSLKASIEKDIPHLQIYTERDGTRRTRSRKFPLNIVVSGYQAHLLATSELQKENIIAAKLQFDAALDSSEEVISQQFAGFLKYLALYAEMDDEIYRIYEAEAGDVLQDPIEQSDAASPPKSSRNIHWLATENVFVSFFAAIAQFTSSEKPQNVAVRSARLDEALDRLLQRLRQAAAGTDPLDLEVFDQIRLGANPRRVNVGAATRKLLVNGFKEFFRDAGEGALAQAWQLAAE